MSFVVYKYHGLVDETRMTVRDAVMDATSSRRTDQLSRLQAELDATREILASLIETLPASTMGEVLGSWFTVKAEADGA